MLMILPNIRVEFSKQKTYDTGINLRCAQLGSTYEYDAWGKPLGIYNASGTAISQTSSMAAINPFRYRGYRYDADTGFYYLQSRYYDPVIGRFINADDPSLLGANSDFNSLNLFAYCGNNPVARVDARGKLWGIATLAAAAIGGIISAAVDVAVQLATTGTVDVGQTVIAAASGAVSGACALIPGGKVISTVVSGVINAGLSAGSYALNQWRKGEKLIRQTWPLMPVSALYQA